MKPAYALAAVLIATLLGVMNDEWWVQSGEYVPVPLRFWPLIPLFFGYVWFNADAKRAAHRPSAVVRALAVPLFLIAIPYYLCRSRGKGQRMHALVGFVIFCVSLTAFAFIGAHIAWSLS